DVVDRAHEPSAAPAGAGRGGAHHVVAAQGLQHDGGAGGGGPLRTAVLGWSGGLGDAHPPAPVYLRTPARQSRPAALQARTAAGSPIQPAQAGTSAGPGSWSSARAGAEAISVAGSANVKKAHIGRANTAPGVVAT